MSLSDIKGQDQPIKIITECLKRSGINRSYFFTGPEGVGKKLLARTLAKILNCRRQSCDEAPERNQAVDSCDSCPSCLKIEQNQHPDVHLLDDSESGSIKIEDIRKLQKDISLRPYEGKSKFFIIDNAHHLTPESANAILKILEEPPKDSAIILISSKPALIFKTILSRCQVLKFYPMRRQALEEILEINYSLDNGLAHFLSFFSEGRLGLALRLKDSGIFAEKNRIIDALAIKNKSVSGDFTIDTRESLRDVLNIIATWFRDIYLLKSGMPHSELINLDRKDDLLRAASSQTLDELDEAAKCVSDSLLRVDENINVKLLLSNLKWSIKN